MGTGDAGLRALILGSAAGGGFPQWNCACRLCSFAWAGDERAAHRTQASLAFSADGSNWLVVGASPDLRQQIVANRQLHPREGLRDSPVYAIAVVSADVDGIAGLVVTRESQPLTVYAAEPVHAIIASNPVFAVLDPAKVARRTLPVGEAVDVGHGLTLRLLTMPGKVPLYLEDRAAVRAEPAATYAAEVSAGGRTAIYAPGCADITEAVRGTLARADAVFFDGTLYTDDEMIAAGVGTKTGLRMGHVPMSGPDGSLARLSDLPGRRIYVHINNTNPVLLDGSPERLAVEAAGFAVAHDGMEVQV
jgi:pyrroloquinoline quinone biosynthesis protein B